MHWQITLVLSINYDFSANHTGKKPRPPRFLLTMGRASEFNKSEKVSWLSGNATVLLVLLVVLLVVLLAGLQVRL
jgi:uncharacterized membrane protein